MKRRKTFEIRFYEKLLHRRPNFVEALISLGDAYNRKGFYRESLEVDRKLAKLRPDNPTIHYNLACSLSLLGEYKQALKELKKAVLLGYDDFAYLLEDSDLKDLRKTPEFKSFLENIKRKAQK